MRYRVQLIPLAARARTGRNLVGGRAQSLTVHSTANPNATAANHADWLTRALDAGVSPHIFVDDIEAVLTVPLDEQGWHAGTDAGNTTSVGIEVCEFSDRARADKADENAQRLIADMLTGAAPPEFRTAHLDLSDVRTHQSWKQYGTTGKYCPRTILPWWGRFVAGIRDLMTEEAPMYYWLIVAIFRTAADAASYAAWCAEHGIAALPSGVGCIAHGNDDKSRRAEAEAERRGGICPWGRVYTTQESYKHFSRRTPLVLPEGDSDASATLAEYEARFDRLSALLAQAQSEIPK